MIRENIPFFCSWSGGKDSCLALYRAIQKGWEPKLLFTMMIEDGTRSRSHGLPINVLKKQAESIGIFHTIRGASWNSYEEVFTDAIKGFKRDGIEAGVFGDIDLDEHREWVKKVCKIGNIVPYHPLWKEGRRDLLVEFINLGFKAIIVSVKDGILYKSLLGKILDEKLVREIEDLGVDPSGEGGELHTVVVDGPIFKFPLELGMKDQMLKDGYWFQDVCLLENQGE